MFLRIVILTIVACLTCPALAFPFQGYVQTLDSGGTIAWGSGEVAVVRDIGKPVDDVAARQMALVVRKTTSQARKQMLDMIMAVRIDAKSTVSAFLAEDDQLASSVRSLVQNSPLERPAVFDDGGTVRVSEKFRGKLAELVLPTTIPFQSGLPPQLSASMEQSIVFEDVPEHVGASTGDYTGVIIDATGLQVTPALSPVIYGQDGEGVYGAFLISRENAINKGIVAYAGTNDPEALRERVGAKPLVVRALSVYGSWRTDLIISSPMARLVRTLMHPGEIVNNCRVVIALDAPVVPMAAVSGGEPEAGENPVKE